MANRFMSVDEFCKEAAEAFNKERHRWLALSPAEQEAELAALHPDDRRYIEHGGQMPREFGYR